MVSMIPRALSNMVERVRLLNQTGRTFSGNRDLYQALGYKRDLNLEDYLHRYKRNSVAGAIVDAFPKGTWRGAAVELIENPDPDTWTPFEQAWWDLSRRLKIWPTLMKADILSGLGRYSVVLLGAPGEVGSPLPGQISPKKLRFLAVYGEKRAKVKDYETNLSSERYGWPKTYQIDAGVPGSTSVKWIDVHWSRVIHIAETKLDEPMFAEPRLERQWNLLDDLEKLTGSGSEAFWLRAHQGYHFDLDKEIELDETGEQEMSEEVDEFVNNIRRAVRTRGVKVTSLGSDVAEFDRNVLSIVSLISSGTGIPQRILLGSEQGQLASEQDRVNWSERVQDRRTEFAGPMVVDQLVNRLIEHKVLPEPAEEWTIRWPRVFDLSEGERIKLAQGIADVNSKFKKQVVTVNETRDIYLGLPSIPEAEQVDIEKPEPAASGTNSNGNRPVAENKLPA